MQVFENYLKIYSFLALKATLCQKILNFDFQVMGQPAKNTLGIKIMFTKYKKWVNNLFSTFSNIP